MKKGSISFWLMLIATILLVTGVDSNAFTGSNELQKDDKLKAAIEKPNFTFVANMAYPTRGRARSLSSNYDLKVSKDTIIAYLPFFGRAYTAPLSPEESGIMFTSTNFSYTSKLAKRGGWEITIKTNDTKTRYVLFLSISKNGYATLKVISVNREGISFSGEIR